MCASPQTENGFTRISNELLEELLKYKFPQHNMGNPLKICLFVIRKTYGFHKTKDRISLTQFQRGLGITRPTIVHWLKYLVEAKLLVKAVKPLGSEYGLNKDYSQWKPLVKVLKLVKARKFASKGALTATSKGALTHKRKKESITKDILQSKDCEEFSSKKYIEKLIEDKKPHIVLIGKYFKTKRADFPTYKAVQNSLVRWTRDARKIVEYPQEEIDKAYTKVLSDFPKIWKLSTILKELEP